MNPRQERGLIIAATCKLARHDGEWLVPSQTSGDRIYRVNVAKQTCTCPDHTDAGHKCKHLFATEIVIKREIDGNGNVTETRSITLTKKTTYKQAWPQYNAAQTQEKRHFTKLLHDLCRGIPQPVQQGRGRPRVPVRDAVYAMTYKVYSTVSTRRFMSDLAEAHVKGFVSRPVHYNSVCRALDNADYTPILRSLITRSSLPLKAIETDFAVDSSGFSTSRFVKWFDHKYGITRQNHDWVKAHIMCGVRTNVITSIEIHGRHAGDSPLLPALVDSTAQNFHIDEVSADKAYSSVENTEAVMRHGGSPYIAFRENATGSAGGLWERAFHFYSMNRDEFMRRYHKRSNVESTFSMLKAKFRDHIRSRSDTAMVNEVLCKALCHNICCVIQSVFELGVEPEFWAKEKKQKPEPQTIDVEPEPAPSEQYDFAEFAFV